MGVQYDILTASVLEVAVAAVITTNDLLSCWSLIRKKKIHNI